MIDGEMTEAEALAEGRMVVEVFDNEGKLVERSFGASHAELLALHRAGTCAATCSWCHQALADKIGEDSAVAAMYQQCFGRPLPTAKH